MTQTSLFDLLERGIDAAPAMPPHNGQPTSVEAAASMRAHVSRLRATVIEAIRSAGPSGLTTDAVELATGLSHQTASPRVIEAARAGLIIEARDAAGNTVKRKTRSGRPAVVWIAAEFAPKPKAEAS